MRSPKIIFTVLGVWFLLRILPWFILAPSVLGQDSELGEKGLLLATTNGQLAGTFAVLAGLILLSLRSIDLQSAKRVLKVTGIGLVAFDVLLVKQAVQHAGEPILQVPTPALVIWIVLTIWTLYVGFFAQEPVSNSERSA